MKYLPNCIYKHLSDLRHWWFGYQRTDSKHFITRRETTTQDSGGYIDWPSGPNLKTFSCESCYHTVNNISLAFCMLLCEMVKKHNEKLSCP